MNTDLQRENSRRRNRIPFLILLVILSVVLVVVVLIMPGNTQIGEGSNDASNQDSGAPLEKWQEGVISHDGKEYLYNRDIKTYLIMGIDKDGVVEEETNYTKGGQSDAMFLLVTDASTKKMSVISINRNTMTRIEAYKMSGEIAGYRTAQICLQHGYGDGKNLSCVRAAEAVSYLFYNIPINGYLAMNMDGMPIMNDAVGGVTVEVLEDITSKSRNVSLKKGETVTLTGDEAYVYLRSRDINEFDSATDRLRRQEQYITAYMKKLETIVSSDANAAVEIYEALEDYIVSSIDFAGLVSEVQDYSFDSATDMYSVPGETKQGSRYEEYYVDDAAFYRMILDIFYNEVTK
ncbi:MAG: LCP family protein [Agathobacter sp.]|nr:LCP family protein [Agathobacter sp.]